MLVFIKNSKSINEVLKEESTNINGLDKYFERQEKAKVMRNERTPDKVRPTRSARKCQGGYSAILKDDSKENIQPDCIPSKRGQNLEDVIIVLHKQLHNLNI